jgi:hypothetical protein
LQGKTAIVTGAASGIGFGIAKALAGAGMNLVLADLQPDRLTAARQSIEALGAKAVGVTVDVSDPASVAAAGRAAEDTFGKLHVAVNNAGVAMHGTPLEQVGIEEWNWVIGVNVLGVINGIRTFVPLIRRHGDGGHVVNTASISGFFIRRGRNQGAYSMPNTPWSPYPRRWSRRSGMSASASRSCVLARWTPASSPRRSRDPIVSAARMRVRSRRPCEVPWAMDCRPNWSVSVYSRRSETGNSIS